MPIKHGWSLNQCPVLLDSGACVPMPFLISVQALEQSCPGIAINPIDRESASTLSAVNGSPLQLIRSVDLHWRFSGRSVGQTEDGEQPLMGPAMQFWYPACAAVFSPISVRPISCRQRFSVLTRYRLAMLTLLDPWCQSNKERNFLFETRHR